MMYLQTFNERLGIDYDIIKQAKEFFNFMKNHPDEYYFNFKFRLNGEDLPIGIIISDDLEDEGQFVIDTFNRNLIYLYKLDYNVLVHELQHFISKNRKPIENDLFYQLDKVNFNEGRFESLIYLMNIDEFKSRYHDMYNELRDVLNSLENVNYDIIKNEFQKFFDNNRIVSVYRLMSDMELKKAIGYSQRELNKNLYKLFIHQKAEIGFLSDIKNHINLLKFRLKPRLNLYSKEERNKLKEIEEFLNIEIKKRAKIYVKKITRIFALLIEEYL